MLLQPEQYALKTVRKDLWANVRGREEKETVLIIQSNYVNVNVLIYEESQSKKLGGPVNTKRAYINSIIVNPVLQGSGLGTIAYKKLENFLVNNLKVKRLFLIPLTNKGINPEGPTDVTNYWKDIGYRYLTSPRHLSFLTTPDQVDLYSEKPERKDKDARISTHMWKNAQIWRDDQLYTDKDGKPITVTKDFEEATDYDHLLKLDPINEGRTGYYYEPDDTHPTLMKYGGSNPVDITSLNFIEDSAEIVFPVLTASKPTETIDLTMEPSSKRTRIDQFLDLDTIDLTGNEPSIVQLQQNVIESSKKIPTVQRKVGNKTPRSIPPQGSHDSINETQYTT
jgi:hypothetical protein